MRPARPWYALPWRLVKRRLPTSLFGRSLLIIILPVALMQIAVTYVFFDAHWQTVNSHLTDGVAGDIAWIVRSYADAPSDAALHPHRRPRPADPGPVGGSAGWRHPAQGTAAVAVRHCRSLPAKGPDRADRRAVLVRHRPLPGLRRRPRQGPPRRASQHRAEGSGVRHEGPYLHPVDGGGDPGADHRGRPLHPQSGASDRAAGRSRRRLWPRRRYPLPAPRRARGAPGRSRLPRHEGAHPAPCGPAHHLAGGGEPRSANPPHSPEAGTGALGARRPNRGDEGRPGRDGTHDRRISRLRPRRGVRERRAGGCAPAARRGQRRRGPGRRLGGGEGRERPDRPCPAQRPQARALQPGHERLGPRRACGGQWPRRPGGRRRDRH